MPTKVIAIGASAGGLEPLREIVGALPADLPAAICVVIHISPTSNSVLGEILDRTGRLRSAAAVDGQVLTPGRIFVAPPDRHLTVADDIVRLDSGPTENGHRPAINPLFRSIAASGSEACAVVLSGTRDDGAAGLAHVKNRGGCTLVQDPADATYPGMPSAAIAAVGVDAILPAGEIAGALELWAREGRLGSQQTAAGPVFETRGAEARLVEIACPECGGVLSEHAEHGVLVFTCQAGHRFGPESLAEQNAALAERALWIAVRTLEERAMMLDRMAKDADSRGQPISAHSFAQQSTSALDQSRVLRGAVTRYTTQHEPPHDEEGHPAPS